jgi:hypothetical protein
VIYARPVTFRKYFGFVDTKTEENFLQSKRLKVVKSQASDRVKVKNRQSQHRLPMLDRILSKHHSTEFETKPPTCRGRMYWLHLRRLLYKKLTISSGSSSCPHQTRAEDAFRALPRGKRESSKDEISHPVLPRREPRSRGDTRSPDLNNKVVLSV